MNIPANCILTVTSSAAVTVDVVVSYSERGVDRERLPSIQQTAFTTATTKTILDGSASAFISRFLESASIRNKDASSTDITVKVAWTVSGTTTTSEVYKVTLAAGQTLLYEAGASGWTVASASVSGEVLLTAPADVANSAVDTLADFTGLSIAVDAGDKYFFRAVLHYSADATTSGSRWTINGPAATAASTGYTSAYSLTATTGTLNYGLAAVQLPAAANATSAATTGNIAVVEGYYTPSTAGTFAIQFAAEAGTITGKRGSTLRIMKVVDL